MNQKSVFKQTNKKSVSLLIDHEKRIIILKLPWCGNQTCIFAKFDQQHLELECKANESNRHRDLGPTQNPSAYKVGMQLDF